MQTKRSVTEPVIEVDRSDAATRNKVSIKFQVSTLTSCDAQTLLPRFDIFRTFCSVTFQTGLCLVTQYFHTLQQLYRPQSHLVCVCCILL